MATFETNFLKELIVLHPKMTDINMGDIVNYNVCDLSLIYNKDSGYEYSLPKSVLESFISGKAFDNPVVYSEEESKNLKDDIRYIYQDIMDKNPAKDCIAIMTAGAPGAGKTIKLKQHLETNRIAGKNFAYICPDDVCLPKQMKTYKASIDPTNQSMQAKQSAYNKWRPGSNAATHLILGNLIREKYAFYFGTTSTGPATGKFFDFLKKQGYKIKLIHVTAPDDVRWESIKERDKTFVQTTEQDVREKGQLLPQRISDTYLAYADEIEFYYRDAVNADAILTARWLRNENHSSCLGSIKILSTERYEKIKKIHNAAVETLKRPDLTWELTVDKSVKRSFTDTLKDHFRWIKQKISSIANAFFAFLRNLFKFSK